MYEVDAFFMARTMGYATATPTEFDEFLVDVGVSLNGPLAALLRNEYQAALIEIREYRQATWLVPQSSLPC
jgi:hypothetical protein